MHPQTRSQQQMVTTLDREISARHLDAVAVEQPLEIRLAGSDGRIVSLATILRTPGDDFALAAGFLFGEGLLRQRDELEKITFCGSSDFETLIVHLRGPLPLQAIAQMRLVITHSGCGACSTRHTVETPAAVARSPLTLDSHWLRGLPELLRSVAGQFSLTGGVHAAGLVEPQGHSIRLFEDVGRHNAVDKLIGQLFLDRALEQVKSRVLLLSGRAGFELLQKAARAGFAAVVSLGAPTTLAVEWARLHQVTLIGFLSSERFNIYHQPNEVSFV
jgi:FdhD protein